MERKRWNFSDSKNNNGSLVLRLSLVISFVKWLKEGILVEIWSFCAPSSSLALVDNIVKFILAFWYNNPEDLMKKLNHEQEQKCKYKHHNIRVCLIRNKLSRKPTHSVVLQSDSVIFAFYFSLLSSHLLLSVWSIVCNIFATKRHTEINIRVPNTHQQKKNCKRKLDYKRNVGAR